TRNSRVITVIVCRSTQATMIQRNAVPPLGHRKAAQETKAHPTAQHTRFNRCGAHTKAYIETGRTRKPGQTNNAMSRNEKLSDTLPICQLNDAPGCCTG